MEAGRDVNRRTGCRPGGKLRTSTCGPGRTEQIDDSEGELVSIHSREAAEVSAMIREMTVTVARLVREARHMRREVARLKTGTARNANPEPSSAPQLPGATPGAQR